MPSNPKAYTLKGSNLPTRSHRRAPLKRSLCRQVSLASSPEPESKARLLSLPVTLLVNGGVVVVVTVKENAAAAAALSRSASAVGAGIRVWAVVARCRDTPKQRLKYFEAAAQAGLKVAPDRQGHDASYRHGCRP